MEKVKSLEELLLNTSLLIYTAKNYLLLYKNTVYSNNTSCHPKESIFLVSNKTF